MKCKKCRKKIPDGSKFCNFCGAKQGVQKMYRRPDGLYEKSLVINGKRKMFRAKTEKEIFQKIAEYTESVEKGPLFSDVAEDWHDEHFPTLSPTTQRGYKSAFEEVKEHFGDKYINQITPGMINKYLKALPSSYARKTVATRLLVLNLIFKYAVNNDVLNESPCSCISVPKGHGSHKRRAPTDSEINTIKANVDYEYKGVPIGLFAVFLLYTGCRRGEALALQYKDIDFKNARLSITKSVYYESTTPYLKKPKTEAGTRKVIIPEYLLKLLPRNKPKKAYIFSDSPDRPMHGAFYRTSWKYWQDKTGLELTAHQLRHGYATILLEADVSVKDAQDLLGHADASTTQNIYQEVSDTRKKQTEIKINNFIH